MSKRFAIRSTRPDEQKHGNAIVFGTGEQVPFAHSCELTVFQISEKEFEYLTGLEPKHIKTAPYYTAEEKTALAKQQTEDLKKLVELFGKDRIKADNKFFWEDHARFLLTNETLSTFFDADEAHPDHILLRWKILGGGYIEEIAPSYEIAQQYGAPFYMTEFEEEAERQTEDISSKVKAYVLLEELDEKKSAEDLLWLSWALHPSNMGYTQRTAKATLYKAHYEYIEGLLVKSKKKSCSKQFIDAVALLKTDKTRLIARAILNASDYFGLVFQNKEGKYQTRGKGTILGSDVDEAVETFLRGENIEELEAIREEVEKKIS